MKRCEAVTARTSRCVVLFLTLLFSSLPAAVLADGNLTCQYQYEINETRNTSGFYAADGTLLQDFLQVENVTYRSASFPCWFEFLVRNSAHVPVKASIGFSVRIDNGSSVSVVQEQFTGATIDEGGSVPISRYYDVSSCELLDSFTYEYHNTRNASYKTKTVPATGLRCTLCGGVPCLNDGMRCQTSSACGSGICDGNRCVTACPEGQLSCAGACLQAARLLAGETYSCEFECRTGEGRDGRCIECSQDRDCTRGICDPAKGRCVEYYEDAGTARFSCALVGKEYVPCHESRSCVLPGSKSRGEHYSCMIECASGLGRGGTCWPSLANIALWTGLFLSIALLLFLTISSWLRNRSLGRMPPEQQALRYQERATQKQEAIRVLNERNEELGRQLVALEQELRRVRREYETADERYKTREEALRRVQAELLEKERAQRENAVKASQASADDLVRETLRAAEGSFKARQQTLEEHSARLEEENAWLQEKLRFARQEAESRAQQTAPVQSIPEAPGKSFRVALRRRKSGTHVAEPKDASSAAPKHGMSSSRAERSERSGPSHGAAPPDLLPSRRASHLHVKSAGSGLFAALARTAKGMLRRKRTAPENKK